MSRYVNDGNVPICNALYPNNTLQTLQTGHWVHAENPGTFIETVEKFALGK